MLLQKIFPHCVVLTAVATPSALKARVSIKYPVYLVKWELLWFLGLKSKICIWERLVFKNGFEWCSECPDLDVSNWFQINYLPSIFAS